MSQIALPREPLSLTTLPEPLSLLKRPPEQLFVSGPLPSLTRAVAIVGTRRADDEALRFTKRLSRDLTSRGVVVVSGGAEGVDRAAHDGALEAGQTIAVLASGLKVAFPKKHAPLFARIANQGALVSEFLDEVPHKHLFLMRNRIIAALARLTIVVQAPRRSGALSTAAHAEAIHRPVYAVPAAPWDLRGEGNVLLLERGALPCTSAAVILDALGLAGGESPSPAASPDLSGLDEDARAVLTVLTSRARHTDEIASKAGLPANRTQRALLSLLLFGHAAEREGGRYVRARRSQG